ncbi:MAG: hypothetical protein JW751_20515 [Polyangiaceae bacterium]|nr:hypothetical protein [Polyangiaceae bacterium]
MDLDDLEREIIGAARREITPTAETAARAHLALMKHIARAGAGSAAVAGAGVASSAVAKAGPVAAIIALGGVGFGVGWYSHDFVGSKPSPPAAPAASAPASVGPGSGLSRVAAQVPDPGPDPRSIETPPPRPVPRPLRSREASPTAQDGEARLVEEARLLREVDRALRQRDPATASRVLDRLDRELPGGKLGEEREAARVLAACLRHPGRKTRGAAAEFLGRHPSTVYSGRIRETCGFGTPPRDGSD